MNNIKEFETTLIKNKKYVTSQRVALFKLLSRASSPLSIIEIANLLENKLDESTIYRNIETLLKLGIVKTVSLKGKDKYELSDTFSPHHHHLVCLNCKKIIHIEFPDKVENSIINAAQKHNFKVEEHSLELSGYCENCK